MSNEFVSVFSVFIPLISILGVFCVGFLSKRFGNRLYASIIVLFTATSIICILLFIFIQSNIYVFVILLGLAYAFVCGTNTMLLTMIPLRFQEYNRVSGIAGFLDFFTYFGAGLAGILSGMVVDEFGWCGVIVIWGVFSVTGVGTVYIYEISCRRMIKYNEVIST